MKSEKDLERHKKLDFIMIYDNATGQIEEREKQHKSGKKKGEAEKYIAYYSVSKCTPYGHWVKIRWS